jgi:dihydroxyacetone kinase-like protein
MTDVVTVMMDVCGDLRDNAPLLNELDGFAGDGDLGVTMSIAAAALLAVLPELEGRPLQDVLRTCGATLARDAPSTSGTLLATGLLRAASAGGDGRLSPAASFGALLEAARSGIAERGKAELGSKTLLDALAPAAAAALAAGDSDLVVAVRAAADAADAGARETTTMQARHGRAGWLAERSMGHEDAGARMVAIVLDAATRSLQARNESDNPGS